MTQVFCRPREVDSEAFDKLVVKDFNREIKRRKYSVDDDHRDKRLDHVDNGKFDVAQISMHDVWQKDYLNVFGKFCPMDADWRCPRCGCQFATGYPPERCPVCGCISPLGQLAENGAFRR